MSGSRMERTRAPRAATGGRAETEGAPAWPSVLQRVRLQTTTTRGRDGARLVGVASLYSDRAALVVPCGLVAEEE
jgi:hypothetical protein